MRKLWPWLLSAAIVVGALVWGFWDTISSWFDDDDLSDLTGSDIESIVTESSSSIWDLAASSDDLAWYDPGYASVFD